MMRALRANSKLAAVLNVNRTAFMAMPEAHPTRHRELLGWGLKV
jgi:hypothetical protein